MRKYTAKSLRMEVNRYFKSISREIVVTEPVPTGELDRYGHPVFKQEPVINRLGEPIKRIEFIEPPMKSALASFLGVHPSTYSKWENEEEYPEFAETLRIAHSICLMWREREILLREGKNIKGITFDLAVNYGISETVNVAVSGGIEEYIRKLEEEG